MKDGVCLATEFKWFGWVAQLLNQYGVTVSNHIGSGTGVMGGQRHKIQGCSQCTLQSRVHHAPDE